MEDLKMGLCFNRENRENRENWMNREDWESRESRDGCDGGGREELEAAVCWLGIGLAAMLLVLLASLLTGCRGVEYVPVETVRVDSTVIRDTAMVVELVPYRDSVAVADTTSYLCNPYAYSRATWSGGMLHHVLGIFPFSTATVKVPYFIDRIVRVKVPKVVEAERKLTRWERIYMDAGKVTLWGIVPMAVIIVGWLVYKIRRR